MTHAGRTGERQERQADGTRPPWLRWAARGGLLVWGGFWTWFITCVMLSESFAIQPVVAILLLWGFVIPAWIWPRIGGLALLCFAGWAVWLFANGAAIWLIALPVCVIVALGWLGSMRGGRRDPAPGGGSSLALLPMLLLLVGATSVAGCAGAPLPAPEPPFHANTVVRHAEGTIAKGCLVQPTVIHGVPCRGWVRLHPDGNLSSYELAEGAIVQGHTLPAATYVWLDDDSRLATCWLAHDATIQGHVCRGGPFKTATAFHPSGRLRAFFPRDDVVVDGVPCQASTQAPVYLHENGRLAGCRLATEFGRGGQMLRRGRDVHFDDAGILLPR